MVDIIIVNWNGKELLLNAVKAILDSDFTAYHIHIVDNNSTDGSTSLVDGIEKVSIYYQKENLGFGRACNVALPFIKGKYILLLNPDTVIKPDTLPKAVQYMQSHLDCTVYGASQVDDDGQISRSCGRFPTFATFCYDVLGLSTLFPGFFKNGFIQTDWDHSVSKSVEHVMGSFYMIRKDWVDEHSFMDDRYFVYLEDLDLSKRVKDSGGSIYYDRENTIYHQMGGVSMQVKAKRLFYSLHARHEYIKKFFSPLGFIVADTIMLVPGFFARMIAALLVKRSMEEVKETYKAHKMLYKHLFFRDQINLKN
jgi:GT2 family glycosyltransferase